MPTVSNYGIIIIRVHTLFPWHIKCVFHSVLLSSWLTWPLPCLLLLYCAATEYSPELDLVLLYCAAKEQGPAPSVTSLYCHRTRPSKGVRLGPKTENCSYCTVLPQRKAQYSDFPYCTVLPQSRAQYRGLLLLYWLAKEHCPARVSDYYGGLLLFCCCHKAGPSTGASCYCALMPKNMAQGVRLRPNTDFSYCTVSPLIRAQDRGPSITVLWCQEMRAQYRGCLLR